MEAPNLNITDKRLLHVLQANTNKIVTISFIIEKCWGDRNAKASINNVRVAINKLKLHGYNIINTPKKGYTYVK